MPQMFATTLTALATDRMLCPHCRVLRGWFGPGPAPRRPAEPAVPVGNRRAANSDAARAP